MILLDSEMHEITEVSGDLDIEFGTSTDSTNDFVMSNGAFTGLQPYGFYEPGTEVGGIFEYSKNQSYSDITELHGYSWRGLLSQALILPPAGSDYKTVTGDADTIIDSIISDKFGGFFEEKPGASSIYIQNYTFPLYINVLDGIEGMLESVGAKLKIEVVKEASGQPVHVYLSAVMATTVSGVYNDDIGIPMTYIVNNMGINHLLCGGSGQLQQRMKVDLYIDNNGNVSETQYYTGFAERTQFYDYPSAQSREDLVDNGTKRLKELANSKTLSMKAPENMELEIGDIVRGQFPDGTIITKPVVKKIYQISNGLLNTEIKIKGEN